MYNRLTVGLHNGFTIGLHRKLLLLEYISTTIFLADVAASAYGRDFLSTNEHGLGLLDILCSALSEAPTGTNW